MILKACLYRVQRMKTQIKLTFTVPMEENEHEVEALEGFKGYLKFAGKPIVKEIEEAMENKHYSPDFNGKTKSQILRGELLTLWNLEDTENVVDPTDFYDAMMDKYIDHVRTKIKKLRDAE